MPRQCNLVVGREKISILSWISYMWGSLWANKTRYEKKEILLLPSRSPLLRVCYFCLLISQTDLFHIFWFPVECVGKCSLRSQLCLDSYRDAIVGKAVWLSGNKFIHMTYSIGGKAVWSSENKFVHMKNAIVKKATWLSENKFVDMTYAITGRVVWLSGNKFVHMTYAIVGKATWLSEKKLLDYLKISRRKNLLSEKNFARMS